MVKIICPYDDCKYTWERKSEKKAKLVTCPGCQRKVPVKKEATHA